MKGAELAAEAGVDALTLTVSASEAYSQRNVRMSVDESLAQVGAIRAAVGGDLPIDTVVSCAFGSPYEGDIAPASVADLGRRALEAGVDQPDVRRHHGHGDAPPGAGPAGRDRHRRRAAPPRHPGHGAASTPTPLLRRGSRGSTRRWAGWAGLRSPAGAGGNLATEDLVHLCDDLGVATGIDLEALLAVSAQVAGVVGHPVPSRIAAAGPRWNM